MAQPLIEDWQQSALEAATQLLIEFRNLDVQEEDDIHEFVNHGCSCSLGPGGGNCCRQFSYTHYAEMRSWCAELTSAELDLVMLGQAMANTNTSDLTIRSVQHHHQPHERQRTSSTYYHQGQQVYRDTLLFLHGIKAGKFRALRRHLRENGLVPRVHGNSGRAPKHALTFADVKQVVGFITNYAEDHAILLPGRIPGYKRSNLQLLPCSTTRRSVWQAYSAATAELPSVHCVSYSTFCRIWRQLLPHILPTRPRTDLCAVCHSSASLIVRNSSLSEAEKSQVRV